MKIRAYDELPKIKSPKFPADQKRSAVAIEREINSVRRRLGFAPDEPLPGLPLFEALTQMRTGKRLEIPVSYAVEDLLYGVEGLTSFERSEIVIALSEQTYAGLERNTPRSRFSLSHEIGHAALHYEEVKRLSKIPHHEAALLRGCFAELPPYADVEWQANAFAGAFLMPAVALEQLLRRRLLSVPELCARFGVSSRCAEIRLAVFGGKRLEFMNM